MTPETILKVTDLHKTYKMGDVEVHALNGVNLEINKGEFVSLMGKSGSGKSTLMNLLGCLDHPTKGNYFFGNEDVGKMNRDQRADIRNRKIGFVFQGFNLLSRTSALDNVSLPLAYSKKFDKASGRERALQLLELVDLKERYDHMPNQLSGGQQQRVAIARSLVNAPEILLADEPTGALDTRTGLGILKIFQELNEEGQSIIMVTHDQEIADCAKRQIIMQDGLIISDKSTANRRIAADELKALDEKKKSVPLRDAS